MTDEVLVIYDERMLEHRPEGWDPEHPEWTEAVQAMLRNQLTEGATWIHPERPQRLSAIRELLEQAPVPGTRWIRPEPVTRTQLERVHTAEHVDHIESLDGKNAWLAQDTTAVSPGSVAAAGLAAGAAVTAVDALMGGQAQRAMALVRPPGHHAPAARAQGFCLYNNVAVAAAHARTAWGAARVLIVDWDMHHGNGTQDIFYEDPDVLFFDTHGAAPFYPNSGLLAERGAGAGTGATLNVPVPIGTGDAALILAFEQILIPAARRFRPDLVLVSAGFDAHRLDQVMSVTEAGFATLCAIVRDIADEHAGGRMALVLEGGYNADALGSSARACLEVLAGLAPLPLASTEAPGLDAVNEAAHFHSTAMD